MRTEALAACLVVAALSLSAQSALAADPPLLDARTRDEARQRFDRGLSLYNGGDLIGALAEFQHAHRLTGHPFVLYNLALVQARLGLSAEAVESLEQLRARGLGELGAEARARAEALHAAELARVGALQIETATPGAQVRIDGVDVARTPSPPLRVSAGQHFVSVSAPGHEPVHLKVTVAGRATEVLKVELTPLEQAPAELVVTTNVPAVEVRAGGRVLGHTPLQSALALKAGTYDVELQRDGYEPVRKQVLLGAGGKAHLDVEMRPSSAGLRTGGLLKLAVSEPDSVVTIDGKPTLEHSLGVRLPLGVHSLRVQRAGFFDVEREVLIRPGTNVVDATLLPTPQYLDDYVSRARRQRTWSYVALGAGAAIAAGGGVFLLYNQGEKNDAERAFDDYAASVRASPNGTCPDQACIDTLAILTADLEDKRGRDVYGWIGIGAGAAVMTAGVLLYALGDDPGRYDPKPESDVFGKLDLDLRLGSVALRGAF